MVPAEVAGPIDRYLETAQRIASGGLAAVYAVGSVALSDFSHRQSNVDLVVVADPRLDTSQVEQLARAARGLRRAGRDAQVWCATWADLDAGGPGTSEASGISVLATPLTRGILRHDPMALLGPDWPVVAHDVEAFRSWSAARLRMLASTAQGLLVLRRAVAPLVLEAARLAQGAIAGRVLSKSEAGESVLSIVSSRHQRVLKDAVGYRQGAQTSMYWGPFERKYDALTVVRELLEAATSEGGRPTSHGTGG